MISYSDYDIDAVFAYFVKGMKMKNRAHEIKTWEAFYDPARKKVIFQLYTGPKEKAKP